MSNVLFGPANAPIFDPAPIRGATSVVIPADLSEIVFSFSGELLNPDSAPPWGAYSDLTIVSFRVTATLWGSGVNVFIDYNGEGTVLDRDWASEGETYDLAFNLPAGKELNVTFDASGITAPEDVVLSIRYFAGLFAADPVLT